MKHDKKGKYLLKLTGGFHMKKIFISMILITLILTGCNMGYDYDLYLGDDLHLMENTEEAHDSFNASQFFVKTVTTPMQHEYFICYRNPDGSETEITSMGLQQNPYYIIGDRIYYTHYDSLVSVDFNGNDKKTLYDWSEEFYSFHWIDSVEGDWLICSGAKWQEIYGDPVALDGMHRVTAYTRVKTDFSEFHEIRTTDVPKPELDFEFIYERILEEVSAADDTIGVSYAGIYVEPNGHFSGMLFTIWAYDGAVGNADKWREGNALVKDSRYGRHVEFIQTDEFELATLENPIANQTMITLAAYIADLEEAYNSPLVENKATLMTEFNP
jgi:hypothetical protein